jgi:hypothetical protein
LLDIDEKMLLLFASRQTSFENGGLLGGILAWQPPKMSVSSGFRGRIFL